MYLLRSKAVILDWRTETLTETINLNSG